MMTAPLQSKTATTQALRGDLRSWQMPPGKERGPPEAQRLSIEIVSETDGQSLGQKDRQHQMRETKERSNLSETQR